MKKLLLASAVAISLSAGSIETAPPVAAANRNDCIEVKQELVRQGATSWEVKYLGDKIAWRESGCKPQNVHRWDDWGNNRFGMNACNWKDIPKAKKQRKRPCNTNQATLRFWDNLCDADVRYDTVEVSVDVRCALALLHEMGTRPWRH